MKSFAVTIGLTLSISLASIGTAQAWECGASSPNGWGIGFGYKKSVAKRHALHQCAMQTPAWQNCFIDYCDPNRSGEAGGKGGLEKKDPNLLNYKVDQSDMLQGELVPKAE